ncbi:MAG: hypothetical protein DMG60_21590, partial [Acidobacteria bacterium]
RDSVITNCGKVILTLVRVRASTSSRAEMAWDSHSLAAAGRSGDQRSKRQKKNFFVALRFATRRPSAERKGAMCAISARLEVDALTRTENPIALFAI